MAPHVEEGTNTELDKLLQYFSVDLNDDKGLDLEEFDKRYFRVAINEEAGIIQMGKAKFLVSSEGKMYVFNYDVHHDKVFKLMQKVGETAGKPLCAGFLGLIMINKIVTSRTISGDSMGLDQLGVLTMGESEFYKLGILRGKLPEDFQIK